MTEQENPYKPFFRGIHDSDLLQMNYLLELDRIVHSDHIHTVRVERTLWLMAAFSSALMVIKGKQVSKWSVWRNIDQDSDDFGKECTVVSFNDDPSMNGDGHIELKYEDGGVHHGKFRRFIPGHTHEWVRNSDVFDEKGTMTNG